jgi:hypothetical protein
MPKALLCAFLLLLPACSGCVHCLFWMLGDKNDESGQHFYSQVEASEAYAEANRKSSDDDSSPWQANALHD